MRVIHLFVVLVCWMHAASATSQPNVIVILLDDMGFSDIGCYGSEIPTPNLDKLAAEGMRFGQFYNAARCVPSRAALMTGNWNHTVGCGGMEGPGNQYGPDGQPKSPKVNHFSGAIRRECPTLAEALRAAGYQNFMVGKWHLGMQPTQRPLDRGFDRFYGFLKGAVPNNFNGTDMWDGDAEIPKPVPAGWYIEDALGEHAVQFIAERDKTKPFFLYYSSSAPHWPFYAKPEDAAKFKGKYDVGYDVLRQQRFEKAKELGVIPANAVLSERDELFAAWDTLPPEERQKSAATMEHYAGRMVNLDEHVGKLMAQLEKEGIADNTIVMFMSDNGAEKSMANYPWSVLSNAPFRYHKHMAHEGGVATPFIVRWPGKVPANTINSTQVGHFKDIMPTLLDATGAKFPETNMGLATVPMAGQSLIPAMKDPNVSEPNTLFWEHNGNEGVRDGPWKLVRKFNNNRRTKVIWEGPRDGEWELYDIAADRTETKDLAAQMPEKRDELIAKYQAWAAANGVTDVEVRKGAFAKPKPSKEP